MKRLKRLIPAPLRPAVRRVYSIAKSLFDTDYRKRKREELRFFSQCDRVHELPAIANYWASKYLVPMLQPFGFANALECFRVFLLQVCRAHPNDTCAFLSIGAGNADAEINMARWLRESGVRNFSFECLDINPASVEKARQTAAAEGVADHFSFAAFDINTWKPVKSYHAVIALQSLHHVLKLELLFDRILQALSTDGYFMADDMIGRNGHQRWPEALRLVHELWKELPGKYRYNHQLRRLEDEYENWDCSTDGFEGIRSQDILALLIERFQFEVFIAFGNIIDIFIDRSFGHNFDPTSEWDRAYIDRVQEMDAEHLEAGLIKPTHMMAVMRKTAVAAPRFYKHFTPAYCVRTPTFR